MQTLERCEMRLGKRGCVLHWVCLLSSIKSACVALMKPVGSQMHCLLGILLQGNSEEPVEAELVAAPNAYNKEIKP